MDQAVADPNVFEVASLCSKAFVEYPDSVGSARKDDVDVLRSRFNLWAAYTGVFAATGASLDDRLEFQDDVKRMVVKLLYMVHRNIQKTIETHQNHSTGERSSICEVSEQCSQTPIPCGTSFNGLEAASAALDRLHRLATAIRRSSVESQKDKLHTNTQVSERDAHLESCLLQFLRDRFPAARTSLLKQVASVLCFYRKRLLYLPRHNKKLANRRRLTRCPNYNQNKSFLRQIHVMNAQRSESSSAIAAQNFSRTVTLSKTDASIPNSQHLRRGLVRVAKTVMSTESTLSACLGERLYYPDPPSFPKDVKFHPCPYCAEPLPTSKWDIGGTISLKFWRDHISRDLEPYFCISEDCRDPPQSFNRFEDWQEHMNSTHTPEWSQYVHTTAWVCQMCRGQQKPIEEKAEFELHIRKSHNNLTTTQMIARTKRSKTKALRDPLACPFCEAVPAKLAVVKSNQQDGKSRALLGKHIAFHIKALSLMCFRLLPSNGQGEDISKDSSNPVEDESTDAHYRRSLPAEIGTTSNDTRGSLASETGTAGHLGPPGSDESGNAEAMTNQEEPEMLESGSWNFIPGFEHLRDAAAVERQRDTSLAIEKIALPSRLGGEYEYLDVPDGDAMKRSLIFSDDGVASWVPTEHFDEHHYSTYLPKLESNFMKDFSCCGHTLPTLHDLLNHYEEVHAQKDPVYGDASKRLVLPDARAATVAITAAQVQQEAQERIQQQRQPLQNTSIATGRSTVPLQGNYSSPTLIGYPRREYQEGLEIPYLATEASSAPGTPGELDKDLMSSTDFISPGLLRERGSNVDLDQFDEMTPFQSPPPGQPLLNAQENQLLRDFFNGFRSYGRDAVDNTQLSHAQSNMRSEPDMAYSLPPMVVGIDAGLGFRSRSDPNKLQSSRFPYDINANKSSVELQGNTHFDTDTSTGMFVPLVPQLQAAASTLPMYSSGGQQSFAQWGTMGMQQRGQGEPPLRFGSDSYFQPNGYSGPKDPHGS